MPLGSVPFLSSVLILTPLQVHNRKGDNKKGGGTPPLRPSGGAV